MMTVIIPALNEEPYLNRTIRNIYETCYVHPEVIVVDQGGNGKIDSRARVIVPGENVGERGAMNLAAQAATNEFLLRIDAHCDFSPKGWDVMMTEVTGEKDLTIAVLTALRIPWDHAPQEDKDKWLEAKRTREQWHDWERLKGHWYGFCRLIVTEDAAGRKGLECKWQKANRDHNQYEQVEPNMGATGCGMMIRKKFYWEIGGADESLPRMGAIGEEFGIKAWVHGGKVQTRTDVMIGHIFGTGGYDTSGVKVAQQALWDRYQDHYDEVAAKFPTFEGLRLIKTDQPGQPIRTVIIERKDTQDTAHPDTGKLVRRRVQTFRYVWLENEHPEERGLTDKELEDKYGPRGTKVGEEVSYVDDTGNLVPAAT